MALMVGTLGMGAYHLMQHQEGSAQVELYRGFFNSADESMPEGIGELPLDTAPHQAHIRFEYSEPGRLTRIVHVNRTGQRSSIPGSKVAEQRL